jgi:hypothetical protein
MAALKVAEVSFIGTLGGKPRRHTHTHAPLNSAFQQLLRAGTRSRRDPGLGSAKGYQRESLIPLSEPGSLLRSQGRPLAEEILAVQGEEDVTVGAMTPL